MNCPECSADHCDYQDYNKISDTFVCKCGVTLKVCCDEELIYGDSGIEDVSVIFTLEVEDAK